MSSNPIVSRQTFSKGSRKLARKSFPVFFSNLVLKTMKDLNSSCKKKEMLWLIILYIRWKMEWLQCKHTLRNISFKSGPGFTQDATASQKNIKSYNRVYVSHHNQKTYITGKHLHYSVFNCHLTWTTPPGLRPIMLQIPRKAESFSSLSRMLRNDVHLKGKDFNKLYTKNKISMTK